ncbi:hypothetical protein [Aliiglaciecola litoralis]|uniref:Anti-sigma factor n=1 Tax=Aliiglaciecola litoralis TaxID=582857 RepID=A0ABN1LGQ3_9ALTE
MSNPTSRNEAHATLLAAWMENSLSEEQRQQFESLCAQDADFAAQVQVANQIGLQAQDYQPQTPPNWNKQATYHFQPERKWWHWQGLPVFSTALSVLAIVLVVSGFEVRFEDDAMTFSFNRSQPNIDQVVEQKLAEFSQQQQLVMNSYAKSLQEQQLATSTQLTNYLLASSRQERKEDFGELIKFINEQRNDDQLFFARQLNQLQQELYDTPATAGWSGQSRPTDLNMNK